MQTNNFWLKSGELSLAVTLKIRSMSPKLIQPFNKGVHIGHLNVEGLQNISSDCFDARQ